MNRPPVLASVLLSLFAVSAFAATPLPATRPAPPKTPAALTFTPGVVLIASQGELPLALEPGGHVSAGDAALAATLDKHGIDRWQRRGSASGATARAGWSFVALRSDRADFDPRAAAADLRANAAIRAACPDYHLARFLTIPNDDYVPYQWYVYSGDAADIKLPQAWDLEHGSASTLIAILDTGVDTGHPDLASKIWINPGEIPGNGIDDDGNGYIDDVKGWDFGDGDNDPNPGPMFEPDFGIDVGFHGTFCAGIAAAATHNVEGIAGAGWNCRIMALKAADSSVGDLTLEAVSAGMTYAADMHASVLSMSLGAPEDPGVPEFFQALVDACDAAGVLVVAAAGNDGTSAHTYPAACDKAVAVAATDGTNARASFSNWGSWVDVNAPGQDMWSAICRNYTIDDNSQIFYEFLWNWDGVNPYMYGDGTSFSTPLVAGVCGLIRSRWPFLTPQATANILVSRGDSVAFDHQIGRKVNAFKAVTAPVLAVAPATPARGARLAGNTPNPFASETVIRLTNGKRGPAHLAIYDLSRRCVRRLLDQGALAPGTHEVPWDGRDAAGRRLGSGIYFAQLAGPEGTSQRRIVIAR